MTTVDELAAWLTQIWDEREEAARFEKELTEDIYADGEFTVEYQWARMTKHASGGYGSSFAKGAPSPTEVLARIAADRQILAEHTRNAGRCDTCIKDVWVEYGDPVLEYHEHWCPTVRLLASPYADRPGYQEAWRP